MDDPQPTRAAFLQDYFSWRPAAPADRNDQLAAVENELRQTAATSETAALRLRQLAGMQLTTRQQLKLESAARRLSSAGARPGGFRPMSVGLLGNRTMTYLLSPLTAGGLARGLLVEAQE